jgi:hypothetical protein
MAYIIFKLDGLLINEFRLEEGKKITIEVSKERD